MAWIMLGLLQGSWRGFAVVCSLPAATTAVLVWALLPESPRYLWKRGQFAKAADALDLIAWWNGGGHGVDLTRDVRGVGANNTAPSSRGMVDPSSPGGLDDATANLISGSPSGASGETPTSPLASASAPSPRRPLPARLARFFSEFFSAQLRRSSALLCVLWFTLSFAWYGLAIWIPTLFALSDVQLDPYQDAFVVSAANVVGCVIAALLIDRIGRKWLMVGSLLGSCGAALAMLAASESHSSEVALVSATAMLNLISVGSWNALDAMSVESFPTGMRTSIMGVLAGVGRIGSITGQLVFSALVSVSVTALLRVVAAMLLIGAGAAWLLWETANVKLVEWGPTNNEWGDRQAG